MNSFIWRVFILIILFTSPLLAQFKNVMISNTNTPEETSIRINPKHPNLIIAAANLNNVYRSSDAGLTWTTSKLVDDVNGVHGDPIVFVDTAGDFYISHLSDPPAGSWVDRIVFQKSTDAGKTWARGTTTGKNGTKVQDKEGIVVNPFNNEIYVSWTQFDKYDSKDPALYSNIMFSKSTDAGNTWSTPLRINSKSGNCEDDDNTVEGAVPAVGPNGEIYVCWTGPDGIVFNKSLDGGNTWLAQEISVALIPGGWNYNISGLQRSNGLPQTLCDLSNGPNRGNIYVNWTDQRNGSTDTDVWLAKSTDGGTTWSAPIRVNDDPPGKQQFLTWMDLDIKTGYIYCSFYDRRDFATTSQQTHFYLARSTDGGNSFLNKKISTTSFIPDPAVFFGDYTGISVYNGIIRPMWMAYSSGKLSVWTAIINDIDVVGIEKVKDNALQPVAELKQNIPNPFNQTTWIKFQLHKETKVNLYVYDLLGKQVAVLYDNELFKEGNYDYIFNSSIYHLTPGVYYYSLVCDEYQITKKMIVN
ncbi:MAG: T9SS type A sorting domain-containing protein [Bacteroidia bacterium]